MISEEYIDSGDTVLGFIPQSWNLIQVGKLGYFGRGRVISNEEIQDNEGEFPVYSSQTKNDGILGYINTYDFEGEYVTWTTDGANAGTVFYRNGKFNCTNVCGTISLRHNFNMDLKFLAYMLSVATKQFVRPDINPKLMNNVMKRILVCYPSLTEQIAIATFLDNKTSQIDQLIDKNQKLIELLEEKRNSLINQAVTKGLDMNVPMKDSGAPWMPKIPKHWKTDKFKFHLKADENKGFPNAEVLSLYRELGIVPKNSRTDNHNVTSEDTSKYKHVVKGNFVVNKMKAWQGSVAVSTYEGIVSPAYYVYKFISNDYNIRYFHYMIRNKAYTPEFRRLSAGIRSGQWDLSRYALENIIVLIPPKEEQDIIVNYLDTIIPKINSLIENIQKENVLLEEYKQSLIYNLVTGKVKVEGE